MAFIVDRWIGMKASSRWALEVPWILNQQPQDSLQLLSTLSVFALFFPSPLDIDLFTWEWSRKTLELLDVHGWGKPHWGWPASSLSPCWVSKSYHESCLEKGWEDKWGCWRAYRFSEMDDSLWAGKTAQSKPSVTADYTFSHLSLPSLYFPSNVLWDQTRPWNASCSLLYSQGFLSARVPQTLCDKRMFTPVMQYLQFLCWKEESGLILQIY